MSEPKPPRLPGRPLEFKRLQDFAVIDPLDSEFASQWWDEGENEWAGALDQEPINDDQDRTAEALAAAFLFNLASQRWIVGSTGQPVSSSALLAQVRQQQGLARAALRSLTSGLYSGGINLTQWQLAAAHELKQAHLAQSLFAVGGKHNLSEAAMERLSKTLSSQYQHLSRFAEELASGQISEAQALARIQQYGTASQQSYWTEYAQTIEKLINWILHPAEHCGDCLGLAAGGPYTVATLPTYPGAGDTECRGNCQCSLEQA